MRFNIRINPEKEVVRVSNHNSYMRELGDKLMIGGLFVFAFVVFILGGIGLRTFLNEMKVQEETPASLSSLLTARLEMPKVSILSSTPEGQWVAVNGRKVFVQRDCANKMTDEAPRLYGPLAEQVGNNGLTVTVPRGSNIWQELEAIVLDAQIPAETNVDSWATWKAETRSERERITANLLEALRRQEGNSLNVVPVNFVVSLRAQYG